MQESRREAQATLKRMRRAEDIIRRKLDSIVNNAKCLQSFLDTSFVLSETFAKEL